MDGRYRRNGVLRCGRWRSCVENGKHGDGITIEIPLEFRVVGPHKRGEFIVQLRQAGPMEADTTIGGSKISGGLEQFWGCETFYSRFLKRMRSNRFIELSKAAVGTINWVERNKFDRVGGQVSCILLFDFTSG